MHMPRRLPSLNGLRAFEAAGRQGSFTGGAKELNVTQTAVSRLVRLLEDRLGFPLFRRHASALELTAQGRALLGGLTDAFDSIARLTESVSAMRGGPVLTVGVGPTLAVNWLIPRLTNFYRSHPEIEVRMATGGATRPVRDDWTCTIRRDVGASSGFIAEDLFSNSVLLVCTPQLASRLRSLDDLRHVTLIRVSDMPNEWPHWFETVGLRTSVDMWGWALFESNSMAIQAVLDGVGVAVAPIVYITDALAAGRLVAPFPIIAQKPEKWMLQYRRDREGDPALAAFREWLHGEGERQRQIEADLINRHNRRATSKKRAQRKRSGRTSR